MSERSASVREKIEAARKQQLKELDLSGSELTSIPPEVFQLKHLESLDLGYNHLVEVPKEIERLKNLKSLSLYWNKIETVSSSIGKLQSLERLDLLSFDSAVPLPEEIGQLSKLTSLRISGISFPESLRGLRNLTELHLGAQKEPPAIPEWLPKARNIISLSLVGFSFSHFPEWLSQWSWLKRLNLSGNQISEIPEWIAELQNLEGLWLVDNHLVGAPEALSLLRELRRLGLWKNRIGDFPDSISKLWQLEELHLGQNELSTLPETIWDLTSLRYLDLSDNQIKKISSRILQLDKLERLELDRNPLEIPPPEIAGKGIEAVREYFRQLTAEGTDHLYEAKLLIVGEGGAGKTTLVKKIADPEYELREEDSTRGIDVVRWSFPLENGRTFQVNMWDFGGQEIYHATHQFFLTKRSLYALVADTRKEDTDFFYWLNIAELLSDGSPILIVKNEKQDRHREINEPALRGRFTNLKETLSTNLATCRGLDKVLEEIRHQITHLPHVGTPLPATWVRVREALEQDPRNYISLEEYLSICERHSFAGDKARLQLSEYLHDLGVCLHFQDDPLLRKTVILRPKWGTDAVYKVLDNPRVIRNLGRFTRADLEHIWDEPEYAAVHDELLQLMMKFKLCYSLPGVAGTYIAPQLLSANQPDYPWDETDNLLLRYTYEFMPKGILTQLIVAMHALIAEQRLVWKSGVVLSKDRTLAEVKEHYDRREIRIRVAGKHRKELLVIATHELDKIHESYPRLEYNKLVPCNCSVCKSNPEPHFYKFNVLRKFSEDRRAIQCPNSYDMVDARALIDDVVDQEQRITLEAWIRSGFAEGPRHQVLFQGPVEQAVLQQTSGETTPAPGAAAVSGSAVKMWQEKLAYALEQEAIAVDPDQKFRLRKLIEEARQKIRELGGQP